MSSSEFNQIKNFNMNLKELNLCDKLIFSYNFATCKPLIFHKLRLFEPTANSIV